MPFFIHPTLPLSLHLYLPESESLLESLHKESEQGTEYNTERKPDEDESSRMMTQSITAAAVSDGEEGDSTPADANTSPACQMAADRMEDSSLSDSSDEDSGSEQESDSHHSSTPGNGYPSTSNKVLSESNEAEMNNRIGSVSDTSSSHSNTPSAINESNANNRDNASHNDNQSESHSESKKSSPSSSDDSSEHVLFSEPIAPVDISLMSHRKVNSIPLDCSTPRLSIFINNDFGSFEKVIEEPVQEISPEQLFEAMQKEKITILENGLLVVISIRVQDYGAVNIKIPMDKVERQNRVGYVYDERMLLHKNVKIFIYEEAMRERANRVSALREVFMKETLIQGDLDEDEDDEDFEISKLEEKILMKTENEGEDAFTQPQGTLTQSTTSEEPLRAQSDSPQRSHQLANQTSFAQSNTERKPLETSQHSENIANIHNNVNNNLEDENEDEDFTPGDSEDDEEYDMNFEDEKSSFNENQEEEKKSSNPEDEGFNFDEYESMSSDSSEDYHPERPDRLPAVVNLMAEECLLQLCSRVPAREALDEELLLVHTPEHIRGVKEYVSSQGRVPLKYDKGDVYLNDHSASAASLACGSVVELTDQVVSGKLDRGIAIVRSPGHHAEKDRATGFCFYSNVAVAAKAMKERYGLSRILIVDWDVHHGNGTQHALEDDPNILFFSVHRAPPFYPGNSGSIFEVGRGPGVGYTINVPFTKSFGDAEMLASFHSVLMPIAYTFNPQLVLVSAGFDAVKGDPLGGCSVSPETYGTLTSMLLSLAGGKIVLALEGGYNLHQTASAYTECLRVLLGYNPEYNPSIPPISEMGKQVIQQVRKINAPFWPQCFWDIADSIYSVPVFDRRMLENLKSADDVDDSDVDDAPHVGQKRSASEANPSSSLTKIRKVDEDSEFFFIQLATEYIENEEYKTAVSILDSIAPQRPELFLQLGEFFYFGIGFAKDLSRAAAYYQEGVDAGVASCKCALAAMYLEGETGQELDVSARQARAVELYQSAAIEDNNAVAYRNLGICYKRGWGLKQDLTKAFEMFKKASELGNSQGMVTAGCMLMEGFDDHPSNPTEAITFFLKAAEANDAVGYYNLGLCAENGVGMEKDEAAARRYFEKAVEIDPNYSDAKAKLPDSSANVNA